MRGSIYEKALTFKAGEDLTAKRFYFMKISAEDTVVTNDTANGFVPGVLQNNVEENSEARIRISGTSKLVAGTAVAVGNYIASNASCKGVPVTPAANGSTNLHFIKGIALSAAAAVDETIEILLTEILAAS